MRKASFAVLSVAALVIMGVMLVGGQGRGGGRGGVPTLETGECPPGHTEVRPGRCQAPEFPPPSILDYRPRSTLVTKETLVPKAKHPVIDIHSHTPPTPDTIDRLIGEMDAMGLRVLVNLSGGSDPAAVKQRVDFIRASQHPDRFAVFANVQWNGAGGPGWAEKAVADLEAAVKNGAIGLKIAKGLGLSNTKADGSRLKVDDPDLKPVWDACARLNIPVIIHTAEPKEFFSPLDYQNERWLELALFPDRRQFMPGRPTFEELQAERDRMFEANPKTRYIGAHFAYYGTTSRQRRSCSTGCRTSCSRSRRALRVRPSAARRARPLHQVPGPHPLRQGLVRPERVPVLLARLRDRRRVLRLLPRLPRDVEAVRHGPARRGAEEDLLQERAARDAGIAAERVASIAVGSWQRAAGSRQRAAGSESS
jgi:predicted TIM-barrel fold metal-dependent hydrolase